MMDSFYVTFKLCVNNKTKPSKQTNKNMIVFCFPSIGMPKYNLA